MRASASDARLTRGGGLLEGFLARQRAAMANRLIPAGVRGGRLLDVGCGSYPYFLSRTEFASRVGIDQLIPERSSRGGITLLPYDAERDPALPFVSESFDVVTMLAVFEHVEPHALIRLLGEIRRVLSPHGLYILTTPAAWTEGIVRTLARLRLLSPEEIEEHEHQYTHAEIAQVLSEAGFARDRMRFGSFELGMNLWATARK